MLLCSSCSFVLGIFSVCQCVFGPWGILWGSLFAFSFAYSMFGV